MPARIEKPDGEFFLQLPHRFLSDIDPFHNYELEQEECSHFDGFSSEIVYQKNWNSPWFQTARRFFLYGSSKEFNPIHNEVDRVVDYMTVMESILVTDGEPIGRRLRERAVLLLRSCNINENETRSLLNKFYGLRSKIVHGDNISSQKDIIERNNVKKFEEIIRKVIIESIQALPDNDENRKEYLKSLFDVSDQCRADKVYSDFCAIKDAHEKKRCFDLISKRIDNPSLFTENRKQKTEN